LQAQNIQIIYTWKNSILVRVAFMTFAERRTTAVTAAALALLAVPVHAVRRRKDDCGNDQTDDEIS
jgi:hypothetical protein